MRVKFNETVLANDIEQVTDSLEQQIQDFFPLVKRVYVKATVRTRSLEQQTVQLVNQTVVRD